MLQALNPNPQAKKGRNTRHTTPAVPGSLGPERAWVWAFVVTWAVKMAWEGLDVSRAFWDFAWKLWGLRTKG